MKAVIVSRPNDSRAYVTGVQWFTISSDSEIKEIVKSEAVVTPGLLTLTTLEGQKKIGITDLPKGLKSAPYSVGAIFANYQNSAASGDFASSETDAWVVIEQFEEGYWVALITAGEVSSEKNGNLTREEAETFAQEFLDFAQSHSLDVAIVGGAAPQMGVETGISLEMILTSSPGAFALSQFKSSKKKAFISFGLIVLSLAFLGYQASNLMGFSFGKSPEDERQAQIDAAIQLADSHYSRLNQMPSLKRSMSAFVKALNDSSLLNAPWELDTANCDIPSKTCSFSYANTRNIPIRDLTNFLGVRCASLSVTTQGTAANCTLQLDIDAQEHVQFGGNAIPLSETLLEFAEMGISTRIGDPSPSVIPGADMAPPASLHREGSWEIEGRVVTVALLAAEMEEIKWAKVKSIQITESTPLTKMKVEGVYVLN